MLDVPVPGSFEKKAIKSEAKRVKEIKKQLTQTDSALNADQKSSQNYGDLMLPDRGTATQSSKKSVDIGRYKHFS